MAELPRTDDGQVALPPTAVEMGRKPTVRKQLAVALEGLIRSNFQHGMVKVTPEMFALIGQANRALDRHRAEPECACDGPDCPGYQLGTEAQRERVG